MARFRPAPGSSSSTAAFGLAGLLHSLARTDFGEPFAFIFGGVFVAIGDVATAAPSAVAGTQFRSGFGAGWPVGPLGGWKPCR